LQQKERTLRKKGAYLPEMLQVPKPQVQVQVQVPDPQVQVQVQVLETNYQVQPKYRYPL